MTWTGTLRRTAPSAFAGTLTEGLAQLAFTGVQEGGQIHCVCTPPEAHWSGRFGATHGGVRRFSFGCYLGVIRIEGVATWDKADGLYGLVGEVVDAKGPANTCLTM